MTTFIHDLRYGFRQFFRNPGFTTVAVLSLALGIGASTAVFSLVNAILLASLPVPNPHELRLIEWQGSDLKIVNFTGCLNEIGPNRRQADSVSYPVFTQIRQQCAEQAKIVGFSEMGDVTVRARREAFSAEGQMVSDNFFSDLKVQPLIGRLFTPGESSPDDAFGVVITYPWWERQFDLDPNALGQSITLNGHSFKVIGVLPQGFPGITTGGKTEFYVSMAAQPQLKPFWPLASSDRWWVHLMARKKIGISDNQLQAVLDVVFANAATDKEMVKEPKVIIRDGRAGTTFDRDYYRKPLLLLLGVVGVVILVVCANLAGLLLSRGAARYHEFAVRSAIGAGRGRLIRQSLTESLLLSLLGGGFGIVLALWGKDVISRLLAGSPQGLHYDTSLDLKVLIYALAIAIATAVLSGLLPALRAAHADPLDGLKARSLLGSLRLRSGRTLVVAQIALSLLLLTGAGLYIRTIINLVHINPGFGVENLLLIQVNPDSAGLQGAESTAYFDKAQNALAAIPGVRSAAVTQYALLGGWMSGGGFFTLPNHPAEDKKPSAHRIAVGESFFSTLGIPLRIGREFTASDTESAPKVVMVNETFVRQYFPNDYPIGQIIHADDADWQVVGVCGDAKYTNIKGEVPPTVYFSHRQDRLHAGFLAVRTILPPAAVANSARQAMASVNPNVPLIQIITQKQVRDEKIAQEWMFAILCGSLAILAVLLSCIGLYGLMAFNVTRRTGEIGIRMALGATRRNIAWPILREALWMSATGALIGGLSALGLTQYLRSQLYGVEPHDPVTMAASVITIFFVTGLAAWFPARRAAKVDPMTALRCE